MKTLTLLLLTSTLVTATPLLDSWLTDLSGRYARLYPDNDAMASQSASTTWSRGQGIQTQPTYAGVNEIAQDTTYVYIRTTGLPFHTMGPWYGGNGNLFPNYPANTSATYRFPKNPNYPADPNDANNPIDRVETGGGSIGFFIDGVAMFDSRDAFSYSTADGEDGGPQNPGIGDDVWLRDAYVNEGVTFDNAFAHQAGAQHHYHANAPGLRHLVGDSVDYDFPSNTYTENFNGNHSPILAWCRDGIPIYGPYAYSDPTDSSSPVRRMISGYQKRDGSNGSTDLTIATGTEPANDQPTGRTTLPAWALRNDHFPINNQNQFGPPVSTANPIGHYLEDYTYKADLSGLNLYEGVAADGAYNASIHFDLNEYNVRFCVTPQFPSGTWAYFMNIEADGTPAFPYNIGRYFFGDVSNNVNQDRADIPAGATTVWEGGPEKDLEICDIQVDDSNDDVTLTWTSAEGGQYTIQRSPDLTVASWTDLAQGPGADATTVFTDLNRASTDVSQFYRVGLNSIDPFDDTGFVYDNSIITQPSENNVLLLILDDWGIDSSELYNTRSGPNIQLANMPNLKGLLYSNSSASPADIPDKGLLFTRGYSQPICSPTRATLLTGRQPYQHGVGNPLANSTLPDSELTFPEIITAEAPNYGLASFGKWHLGSGDTGPLDTGGWPNFSGTLTGGVPDYADWDRVKIENEILVDSGTAITTLVTNGTYSSPYATSVQVDEAISFINAQGSNPWVTWMGFNAPHLPFQDPAPYVTPTAGYSTTGTTDKDYYVKMLEALDHEIGRLLTSVDLSTTNIIVIGDNGTPGQTDQAPAGGIASAKGSLNEGGIHVPFFATGPDVFIKGKSDELVHVADLFATILDLTNVNVSAATAGIDLHSTSLFPIFQGNDMEDRCLIAEKFGLNAANDGRALIDENWPDYKLIAIHDVTDPNDTPSYQMYQIGTEGVEINTLTTPPASGDPWEAAYNTLVAKDQSLILPTVTPPAAVDIDLPSDTPPLINIGNGNIIRPNGITIGGVAATWDTNDITVGGTTTSAARVDESGDPDQFSVVAEFDVAASGLGSGSHDIIVSFPGAGGTNRVFTATNTFDIP